MRDLVNDSFYIFNIQSQYPCKPI